MSAVLITILAALTATASPDCSDQLFGNAPPAPVVDVASWKVRDLCFAGFRLEHSGLSRTPLWVGEHLTADRIEVARALPRKDQFHPESSLPKDERAEMADYRGGGYDRGHMAPDGDMADPTSEHDSFSLANMIPQVPSVNRGGWAHLEAIVRKLAERDGEVYVVTGPIFAGDKLQALNDHVLVPTGMFKAVFDPKG
jgi:endonuclease G